MAKALQCPSCGTKKRIDTLAGSDTFQCAGCGQVTKVPPGITDDHRPSKRASGGRSEPAAAVSSGGAAPAPPRRRGGSVAAAAGSAAVPGPGAGVPAVGVPAAGDPGAWDPGRGGVVVEAPPERGARRAPSRGIDGLDGAPRQPKIHWRVLAWLVALPIALAAVGIPARGAGYLNSQRLLDVIVDKQLTRFVPIVVIIVLWALTTAVLVTAMISIGQRMAARRRAPRSG